MATSESLKTRVWTAPFLLAISILFGAQALSQEAVTDQETELGLAAYEELRDKVEIIESSPLYDRLNPVAEAITRVAQPRYEHPFKFFLVHETRPNAFATPGGNVYVVDSLLYFVKNTETAGGNPLPRGVAYDSSRRHESHKEGGKDHSGGNRRGAAARTDTGQSHRHQDDWRS